VGSEHPWEGILHLVQSPQQYTGREWNSETGPAGRPSVTLVYPDTYELGMSNFGLAVVRHILLATGRFHVRRAFCPAPDMLSLIRSRNLPWMTLDDPVEASDCDLLAFGIPCEILFPNLVMLLGLAGIPLRSADRDDSHPIVVAGGGGLSNPLPLSPFIDAFYLGDAETGAVALMDELTGGGSRTDRLARSAAQEGVWVPSMGRRRVRWQRAVRLDPADAPVNQVVPTARIVHDRAVVEIARGCTRGCRFCQATQLARPVRERSVADIESIARRSIASTGWEDAGLLTLSFSDFTDLPALLAAVDGLEKELAVNISRPSLRPDTFVRLAGGSGITGRVTLAPEAGSETFRRRLNKDLGDAQVIEAVNAAFRLGATGVKLYFMAGLPGETDDDLRAIADLSSEAARAASRAGRSGSVSISISPFVPKPHTPLQWCGQHPPQELRRRIALVRSMARRFTVGCNDPDAAALEGLMGLGDGTETPCLIEEAVAHGAGFEGWKEHFRRDIWKDCAEEHPALLERLFSGLDPSSDPEWSFVEAGSSVGFLREEYARFLRGEATPDCRESGCNGCGACDGIAVPALRPESADRAPSVRSSSGLPSKAQRPVAATLRIRFGRRGLSRFTSQLDLTRLWMRTARRSGLPVALSAGHVTRPRLRFGPALPLGFESTGEYIDILLCESSSTDLPLDRGLPLPEGFFVTGARLMDGRIPSPEGEAGIAVYRISDLVSAPDAAGLLEGAGGLLAMEPDGNDGIRITAVLGEPASRPDRLLAAMTSARGGPVLVKRVEILGERDGCPVPLLSMHEGVDLF